MTFTRRERNGGIALCGLLLVLLAIRTTMHIWVRPPADPIENKRLIEAWQSYQRSQPAAKDTVSTKDDDNDFTGEVTLPDHINLNTADSALLVRLKGIGPVTAARIITRRKTKGSFTKVSQIKEVGSFNARTYKELCGRLTVDSLK